jgi:hypothetical protein
VQVGKGRWELEMSQDGCRCLHVENDANDGHTAVSTIVCHVISTESHVVAGTYFTTLTHMHNTHPPIKLRGMQCRWI